MHQSHLLNQCQSERWEDTFIVTIVTSKLGSIWSDNSLKVYGINEILSFYHHSGEWMTKLGIIGLGSTACTNGCCAEDLGNFIPEEKKNIFGFTSNITAIRGIRQDPDILYYIHEGDNSVQKVFVSVNDSTISKQVFCADQIKMCLGTLEGLAVLPLDGPNT